ncbi:MAG: hypothetical protein OEY68_07880 [Gammaproteobacteria bacterium]|nr:hypothetical protein [Gammaproteobacteria bacterium]
MMIKLFKLMLVLQAVTIGGCILFFTALPFNQVIGWVLWSTILFSFASAAGLLFVICLSIAFNGIRKIAASFPIHHITARKTKHLATEI